MTKVEEIIAKYNLKPNHLISESPFGKETLPKEITRSNDAWLLKKWESYIPDGWYGFSLNPCPDNCADAIDEFLQYVKETCPDFEILQIKIKFGGLRMYLGRIYNDDVIMQRRILEDVMVDEKLIY